MLQSHGDGWATEIAGDKKTSPCCFGPHVDGVGTVSIGRIVSLSNRAACSQAEAESNSHYENKSARK
jgi:hypothetical protein